MDSHISCLNVHLEAENSHDLEAIMATYVSDPSVTINGQTFRGLEKVRFFHDRLGFGATARSLKSKSRNGKGTYREMSLLSSKLSPAHTGIWQGIQPTHKNFEVQVCTVYSFNGAKLRSEDVYFDSCAIYKLLGIAL